jgi:hypothetical protein
MKRLNLSSSAVRRSGLALLAAGGVVALLLAVDPASVYTALRRFDGAALLPLLMLGVATSRDRRSARCSRSAT